MEPFGSAVSINPKRTEVEIKIAGTNIMLVDDDEKDLIEVADRFPAARLAKAP